MTKNRLKLMYTIIHSLLFVDMFITRVLRRVPPVDRDPLRSFASLHERIRR